MSSSWELKEAWRVLRLPMAAWPEWAAATAPEIFGRVVQKMAAAIWLEGHDGFDEMPIATEIDLAFHAPDSAFITTRPVEFVRAVLQEALFNPEMTGWQRDSVYGRLDELLDRRFGLDVANIERGIKGQTASRLGPAAWSEANPENGWLTNYADFYFLLGHLNLKARERLVDIGSGHGRTGFLTGLLFPQVGYLGVEIVEERTRVAQEIALRQGWQNVRFELSDVSDERAEWPVAEVYYLYDALNRETASAILDKIAAAAPQSRLVVRDGKGIALSLLSKHRKFKQLAAFLGDERLHQSVTIFAVT